MKKAIAMVVLISGIIGIAARPVVAAEKLKWFGDLEMFTVANVADGEEEVLYKEGAEWLNLNIGGDSASFNMETTAAVGARVGVLYPVKDVGDFGMSVGYIGGPNSEVKTELSNDWFGTSYYDYERELSFVRVLGEFRKEIAISEKWVFKPAFGIGVAFGSNKVTVTRATNLFDGCVGESESKTWSGLTWEITPGFAYKMKTMDLNLALKYAAFPKFKEDMDKGLSKIDWGTIGFSIGLGF